MKKPLIVLVDDEPAVLEALEAELSPVFNETCRIELFSHAQEVLESLPRWSKEQRAIAVAIVDQKMPDMLGTELVAALRHEEQQSNSSAPCMEAILLTGQAGLESAIEGKNRGGIARYIEKPWSKLELCRAVHELFSAHIESTGTNRYFLLGETTDSSALAEHLRLRYDVYRTTSGIHNVLPAGESMDVDSYDAIARFLSLTIVTAASHETIGTLRVVGETESPSIDALKMVVSGFPALEQRLQAPRQWRLPLMEYLVDRDAVEDVCTSIQSSGETVVEPGRLALAPHFRSRRPDGVPAPVLVRFMLEGATAFFFFFFFIDHAILTCIPAHRRLYRGLGFQETAGTRMQRQPSLQCELACLHAAREEVPEPARSRIQAMAQRVEGGNPMCLCPSFPSCLGDGYESGTFAESDVYCPLKTEELRGDGPR